MPRSVRDYENELIQAEADRLNPANPDTRLAAELVEATRRVTGVKSAVERAWVRGWLGIVEGGER